MEDRCFKFINELNSQVFDAHMKKITKDNLSLLAIVSVFNTINIIIGIFYTYILLTIGITLELFIILIILIVNKSQKATQQKLVLGLGDNFLQEMTLFDDHMFIKETSTIRYGTVNFEYKFLDEFYEFENIFILTIFGQILLINRNNINNEIENFIKMKAYENSTFFQGKKTKQIKDINKYLKH